MIPKRYPVVIEPTNTGYSAFHPMCPDVRRPATQRKRRVRISRKLWAAHFEVMREIGEPIPEPRASVDYVEVAA
jgi:predicted RNase H-like HicB family nuclease